MIILKAYLKNVYGKTVCYLKEGDRAEAIKKLTGKKTLLPTDIEALKELNVFVKIEAERTEF
jgi:hypothetical protein